MGDPIRLPYWKVDFRTVLSQQKSYEGHSGAVEAVALVLGVRWQLRSKARFAKRLVLLVDAQAVLFAAAKGRSSAPSLRFEMSTLAALALVGDLLIKYIYIPSEYNPADAPSRGITLRCDRARL